jgi:ribosomal protein S12 methylthiotransferase accessory factor
VRRFYSAAHPLASTGMWPDVSRYGAWTSVVLDWVDARYGPVLSLRGQRLSSPEPAFWLFGAELARMPVGSWFAAGESPGAAGTSIDAEEALVRCLGEIAERYSAMTAPIDGTVRHVDSELVDRLPRCAVDERCVPSMRGQMPATPVTHLTMNRLADGAPVDIPAGYVHLAFRAVDEPLLTTPISTGLAFDPSLETAIWRGLCEAAERDAMMLMWWRRRTVPEIDMDWHAGAPTRGVPVYLSERLLRLEAAGLKARFFDITSDFVAPTVFCVLDSDDFPYRIVGACCRDDFGTACAKALDETVSVRQMMHADEPFTLTREHGFDWVTELEDHARIYAHGHLAEAFDFLLDSDRSPVSFDDAAAGYRVRQPGSWHELVTLAGDLQRRGLTVFWTDVTAPELDGTGHVVKVFVPEMIPLSQWHSARWLGSRRLAHSSDDTGRLAESFNPYPHPFA